MAVAADSAVQPPAMHYFALSGHQLKSSLAKTRQLVGLDPCCVCSRYKGNCCSEGCWRGAFIRHKQQRPAFPSVPGLSTGSSQKNKDLPSWNTQQDVHLPLWWTPCLLRQLEVRAVNRKESLQNRQTRGYQTHSPRAVPDPPVYFMRPSNWPHSDYRMRPVTASQSF